MTTADSHIGSNRQHRLSDQVPANTAEPSGRIVSEPRRYPRNARNAAEIHGFSAAVPEVRIHLPPAVSLRTIGSRNTKSSVTEPPPGATPICVRPAKLKERGEVKARGALRHALAATLDRANNSAFAHD